MPWTLFAAGGLASIPILIHIFNRTRYRRIQWAAMDFLLAAYKRTRKRMQFENLLLLILRVLAMLFLAFAFVPQDIISATDSALDGMDLHLAQSGERADQQHMIVVVDDSASMRYLTSDGNKVDAYAKALEHAKRYIDSLSADRDKVTLLFPASQSLAESGREDGEESAFSLRELTVENALATLEAHQASYTKANLLEAFKLVSDRVSAISSSDQTPRVVVISDFQANEWQFAESDSADHQTFKGLIDGLDYKLQEAGSNMVFVNALSADKSERANVGIVGLELATEIVGVGMDIKIKASVINASSNPEADPVSITLEYQLDSSGMRRFDKVVQVPSGETREVIQPIGRFAVAGPHRVLVRIAAPSDDSFQEDNQANLALFALDEVPILVVEGESASKTRDFGEAIILRTALQVSEAQDAEGKVIQRFTPNKVTVIRPDQDNREAWRRAKVVMLTDVDEVPDKMLKRLQELVAAGRISLLITLGNNTNMEKFNEKLWAKGKGLSPAKLTSVLNYKDGVEETAALELNRFRVVDNSVPKVLKLRENEVDAFGEERAIAQWYGSQLPKEFPDLKNSKPSRVVLAVDDPAKSPLLVTRQYGRGMVALWTSSIDDDWTKLWDLGDWPLLRISIETAAFLSGVDSRSRSLEIGDLISQDLPLASGGYTISAPREGSSALSSSDIDDSTVRARYKETFTPGIYKIHATDESQSTSTSTQYFSVSMPKEESNTDALGNQANSAESIEKVMTTLLEPYEALAFETEERSSAEIAGAHGDREMDRWLLFLGLAMLCMFGEFVVTTITGRRREA